MVMFPWLMGNIADLFLRLSMSVVILCVRSGKGEVEIRVELGGCEKQQRRGGEIGV